MNRQNYLFIPITALLLCCLIVLTGCPTPVNGTSFSITFDSNGGSAVTTQTIKIGDKITKPTDPTKDGFNFDAWYKGDVKFDFSTPIKADITLKAKWTVNQLTVTFDSNGGSAVTSQTVAYGSTATRPTDPTKDGFNFVEWKLGDNTFDFTATITENITLKASWSALPVYTVTFNSDGGSFVPSLNIISGRTVAKPTNPTKDGFTFDDWYKGDSVFDFTTVITENITLKAAWTVAYNVTFNDNYTGATTTVTQATKYSDYKVTANTSKRDGYTLEGWYTEPTCTNKFDFATVISADISLYAKWTLNEYTITYILYDGTNSSDNPVTYSAETDSITLKAATKEGFSFKGWYSNSTFKTKVETIEKGSFGNKTLYAKWGPIEYTITYVLDGGINSSDNPTTYSAETDSITLKPATKKLNGFMGWYSDSTFTTEVKQINKGSTGDLTLYAKFLNRWLLQDVPGLIATKDLVPYADAKFVVKITSNNPQNTKAGLGGGGLIPWTSQSIGGNPIGTTFTTPSYGDTVTYIYTIKEILDVLNKSIQNPYPYLNVSTKNDSKLVSIEIAYLPDVIEVDLSTLEGYDSEKEALVVRGDPESYETLYKQYQELFTFTFAELGVDGHNAIEIIGENYAFDGAYDAISNYNYRFGVYIGPSSNVKSGVERHSMGIKDKLAHWNENETTYDTILVQNDSAEPMLESRITKIILRWYE